MIAIIREVLDFFFKTSLPTRWHTKTKCTEEAEKPSHRVGKYS